MRTLAKLSSLLALTPVAIFVLILIVALRTSADHAKLLIQLVGGGGLVASVSLGLYIWQIVESRKVHCEFGVRAQDRSSVILWVSNNGPRTFTITGLFARTNDAKAARDVSATLKEGDRKEFDFTPLLHDLADNSDPWFDFDAWFALSAAGHPREQDSRPFNVFGADGNIISAGPGYAGHGNVRCPKCRLPAAFKLVGLKRLDQLPKRRRRVERDLKASCPNHDARWLLTPKDVGRKSVSDVE